MGDDEKLQAKKEFEAEVGEICGCRLQTGTRFHAQVEYRKSSDRKQGGDQKHFLHSDSSYGPEPYMNDTANGLPSNPSDGLVAYDPATLSSTLEEPPGYSRTLPATVPSLYNDTDVLIGPFKFCRENGGNIRLKRLVLQRLRAYVCADMRTDYLDKGMKQSKNDLKREVLRAIKESGGRFLKVLDRTGNCKQVSDAEALVRVGDEFAKERRKMDPAAPAIPTLRGSPEAFDSALESSLSNNRTVVNGWQSYDDFSWIRPFTMVGDDDDTGACLFPQQSSESKDFPAMQVDDDLEPTIMSPCFQPAPAGSNKTAKHTSPAPTAAASSLKTAPATSTAQPPNPIFEVLPSHSQHHAGASQVAQLTRRVAAMESELRHIRQNIVNEPMLSSQESAWTHNSEPNAKNAATRLAPIDCYADEQS